MFFSFSFLFSNYKANYDGKLTFFCIVFWICGTNFNVKHSCYLLLLGWCTTYHHEEQQVKITIKMLKSLCFCCNSLYNYKFIILKKSWPRNVICLMKDDFLYTKIFTVLLEKSSFYLSIFFFKVVFPSNV